MTTSAYLIDAANNLIAESLRQIGEDEPEKHKALVEYAAAAGTIPRLLIESQPDVVVISLTIAAADGFVVHVFEHRVKMMNPLHH